MDINFFPCSIYESDIDMRDNALSGNTSYKEIMIFESETKSENQKPNFD